MINLMPPKISQLEQKILDKIINLGLKKSHLDLSSYRNTFLLRRIKSRMYALNLTTMDEYIFYLSKNNEEWLNFISDLSINVSSFFRDPEVFSFFEHHCLPELIERKKDKKLSSLRIWSAGCSFGEEPYSLAIIVKRFFKGSGELNCRIWATDIDDHALSVAKEGRFPSKALKNILEKDISKYFIKDNKEDYWQIKEELKKMVMWKKHNLFDPPPFKFVDVVFCRNVRIYFTPEQSEKVLINIANAMNQGGYLVLGKIEMMPLSLKNVFEKVEGCFKIFKKL